MAGFFFARAGPRPIILIKEILDYQARHPDQHDQQSFNLILSELLTADVSVAVMHPRLFPNGFQYFNKRTVQREGGAPLVIQNNWIMGAENKRHRFREAHLWRADGAAYYAAGPPEAPLRLLRYDARQPFVSGLMRETSALRAALRVALLLNRTLLLPRTCAFTSASGLHPPPPLLYRDRDGLPDANVLDDAVDAEWCTTEWFFDMAALHAHFNGFYRESSFLEHPHARAAFAPVAAGDGAGAEGARAEGAAPAAGGKPTDTPPPTTFFIAAAPEWQRVPSPPGATLLTPASLEEGATDDEIRRWFAPHADAPLLDLGDMAGRMQMPRGGESGGENGGAAGEEARAASLTARLARGVAYREEIERYVQQQVAAAAPFECLCVPGAHGHLSREPPALAPLVRDFAKRVPPSTTVFVASYRADLDTGGIEAFRSVWDQVFALALYDWNGAGLQGRQFSSAINRLVCARAERIHWPEGSASPPVAEQGCW